MCWSYIKHNASMYTWHLTSKTVFGEEASGGWWPKASRWAVGYQSRLELKFHSMQLLLSDFRCRIIISLRLARCGLRYRVPIKQEIDENDTGHYEGRIVDKRIGGQDCATFPFESCERKQRTCDSSYNFIQWRSHPSSPFLFSGTCSYPYGQ